MLNCEALDPLVTPYVDGQLADADRRAVDDHLRGCAPCHSRVAAERAVHELIRERKSALTAACCAPDALHMRCASQAQAETPIAELQPLAATVPARAASEPVAVSTALQPRRNWQARLAPLAAAASLVVIVGGAFTYQLTQSSSRVLAAELAADHVKCFAMNGALRTHDDAETVESSMLSGFDWRMHLPQQASSLGLELIGSRPCLYGQGKIAHIMYRHRGEPVSLFMLPRTERAAELVQVLGHRAAIWCAGNRTFVLLARESREEVERMATAVQASLR